MILKIDFKFSFPLNQCESTVTQSDGNQFTFEGILAVHLFYRIKVTRKLPYATLAAAKLNIDCNTKQQIDIPISPPPPVHHIWNSPPTNYNVLYIMYIH